MIKDAADWREDLARWLAPFVAHLSHLARRKMCPLYVAGLIGPGDHKSVHPRRRWIRPPTPKSNLPK
jgi:hypothetical protein